MTPEDPLDDPLKTPWMAPDDGRSAHSRSRQAGAELSDELDVCLGASPLPSPSPSPSPRTGAELYEELDACLDREDYEGARRVKAQIDQLTLRRMPTTSAPESR